MKGWEAKSQVGEREILIEFWDRGRGTSETGEAPESPSLQILKIQLDKVRATWSNLNVAPKQGAGPKTSRSPLQPK